MLTRKARSVLRKELLSRRFAKTIDCMVETMRHSQGVGLAANQIGVSQRIFVMECHKNSRYPKAAEFPLAVYLNPKIVRFSREKSAGWEGCLSIPGYRGRVMRSREIALEAWTPVGERVMRTLRGFEARVVQHEVDHLDGFFYMNRMQGLKHWMHLDRFNQKFSTRIREKDLRGRK